MNFLKLLEGESGVCRAVGIAANKGAPSMNFVRMFEGLCLMEDPETIRFNSPEGDTIKLDFENEGAVTFGWIEGKVVSATTPEAEEMVSGGRVIDILDEIVDNTCPGVMTHMKLALWKSPHFDEFVGYSRQRAYVSWAQTVDQGTKSEASALKQQEQRKLYPLGRGWVDGNYILLSFWGQMPHGHKCIPEAAAEVARRWGGVKGRKIFWQDNTSSDDWHELTDHKTATPVRQVDPEVMAKINDLSSRIHTAPTEVKSKLRAEISRLQASTGQKGTSHTGWGADRAATLARKAGYGSVAAFNASRQQESRGYDSEWHDDYDRVREEVINEWMGRKRHQSWRLVPKAKLVRLYREYGKFGRVNEGILLDVWSILHDSVLKVIINSETRDSDKWPYGDEPDLYKEVKAAPKDTAQAEFALDDPRSILEPEPLDDDKVEKVRDKEWDRWFLFVSDLSNSQYVRNFGEVKGNARYSDASRGLIKLLQAAYATHTPEEQFLAVDRIFNFAHGLGRMAKWFVEGGGATLDQIFEWSPKGMTGSGLR